MPKQGSTTSLHPPIAIIGVSALFPGSSNTDGFWQNILEGKDLIGDVPKEHWLIEDYYDPNPKAPDKTYARRGAFLDPVDFDALAWGIPPSTVPATDTAQLLALIVAEQVLEDASRAHQIDKSRTSVILGVTSAQELLGSMVSRLQAPVWRKSLREMGLPESQVQEACKRIAAHYTPWQEATFPGILGNVVAGRIANRLNLGGTNCVTDAACASTFSALSMAVNELSLGQSDFAIAGGVDTMNDIFMFMCFSKTPALSPSGDCRPFSAEADGTMLGEGLGMFALTRLDDALARGDRIYGVIRGIGGGSDGRAKSVYAPLAEGQARTLRTAYQAAGYSPRSVELVEAHGTGTKAGDAAEFAGLMQVFGNEHLDGEAPWCALGSVKSQVGHTKAAAGAAGLFKALMAINEGVLPPSIKITQPNPKLELDNSPFHLSTRTLPWIRASDHPRRASVSAFGFGGSNFHVALEAPPQPAPRRNTLPQEIIALDAPSPQVLLDTISALKDDLSDTRRFRFLARRSHQRFNHGSWRVVCVSKDAEELRSQLAQVETHLKTPKSGDLSLPARGIFIGSNATADSKTAFMFPGQGSQYVDMGADVAVRFTAARGVWDTIADIPLNGGPLHKVVYPPASFNQQSQQSQQAQLTKTEWAQPALGATSLSIFAILQAVGLKPDMLAGHSFGELAALAAAGALSSLDLTKIARKRGELMAQAATQPGAMLAVSASLEDVRKIVEKASISAEIANHNAPNQVVLAGPVETITAAQDILKEMSIRCSRLPVATAFHSSLVADATQPFAEALSEIDLQAPTLPVYANVTASAHDAEPTAIKSILARQLASPVRFVEMVEAMYEAGARTFVEVGPGSILTSLISRILEGKPHRVVATDRKGRSGYSTLCLALAELAASGADISFTKLFAEYDQVSDPAEKSPPKLAISISGANQGKPYPPKEGSEGLPPPNPEATPAQSIRPPIPPPRVTTTPMATKPSGGPTTHSEPRASSKPPTNGTIPHAPDPRTVKVSGPVFTPKQEPRIPIASPAPMVTTTPAGPNPPMVGSTYTPSTSALHQRGTGISTPTSGSIPAPVSSHMSSPTNPTPPHPTWFHAWHATQLATAQTQATYQQAMADSHMAYLQMVEASFAAFTQLASTTESMPVNSASHTLSTEPSTNGAATMSQHLSNGRSTSGQHSHTPVATIPSPLAPTPTLSPARQLSAPATSSNSINPAPSYAPIPSSPPMNLAPASMAPAIAPIVSASAPMASTAKSSVAASTSIVSPLQARAASISRVSEKSNEPDTPQTSARSSIEGKLLAVIAEATGYPEDVLKPSMSLEADLGIDSIKRVEILSMVKKVVPELPEL
nr:acyltransferase domain-containing protein [Myxococcales bacterium]